MANYETPVWDLGNPTWMQVIADAGTPADLVQYNGRFIAIVDSSKIPPLGQRGMVLVSGITVPGYVRVVNGEYQWVLTAPVDPLETLVNSLPGSGGWKNTEARATWLQIGASLRGFGISGSDLAWGLPALFNAARTEVIAQSAITTTVLGKSAK